MMCAAACEFTGVGVVNFIAPDPSDDDLGEDPDGIATEPATCACKSVTCKDSSCTCAVSTAITRYAPDSRAASSAWGSTGTLGPDDPAGHQKFPLTGLPNTYTSHQPEPRPRNQQ